MKTTIILPVFNERDSLERNFPIIYKYMKDRTGSFAIIIAEDGSTDGSDAVARRFSRLSNVHTIHGSARLGRGGALKKAIRMATGGVIGYTDIDLATPMRYVTLAIDKVMEGNDVVAGSRYEPGSRISRSILRLLGSKAYNFLLFALFGSRIKDHQCGFKFWKASYIKNAVAAISDNHWFFDSEMLIRAERRGARVFALPVAWKESRRTKVRLSDIPYFINCMLRLRRSMSKKHATA